MNDWLDLQRAGIANSQANAQKKQTDELLKAQATTQKKTDELLKAQATTQKQNAELLKVQNQTNKLLDEAARAEREKPQCPHCGGKLNGKFDICQHCRQELHYGVPQNPFKTLIEAQQNILEIQRQKEVKRQKEVERQKKIEQEEIERQKGIERQWEIERQSEIEHQKEKVRQRARMASPSNSDYREILEYVPHVDRKKRKAARLKPYGLIIPYEKSKVLLIVIYIITNISYFYYQNLYTQNFTRDVRPSLWVMALGAIFFSTLLIGTGLPASAILALLFVEAGLMAYFGMWLCSLFAFFTGLTVLFGIVSTFTYFSSHDA